VIPLVLTTLLLFDVHFNGQVITCATEVAPVYSPDTRLFIVLGCSDIIFAGGFE